MIPDPSSDDATWRFLNGLFKQEVPEIAAGIVEIRAVARKPGAGCKVAIHSYDPSVDGVAVCAGLKGMRVRRVVDQLGGERVDLFPWTDSPERLIRLALAPARTDDVVLDHSQRRALVTVPEDQLSVASGRDGANRELASSLTGWDIHLVVRKDAA
jgi:N utilization substance protein A